VNSSAVVCAVIQKAFQAQRYVRFPFWKS